MLFDCYYLQFDKKQLAISDHFIHPNSYFRINKKNYNDNYNYYYLQIIRINYLLSVSFNKELIFIEKKSDKNNLTLWEFINTNNNKFAIKNKNNCFIKVNKLKITCEIISIEKASLFNLIKIYEEGKEKKNDEKILEKEPIDVLIKYIDLRDSKLKRNNIHQIEKDYDNEELKYSIRSIIKNIPWIRKIFILMPNEEVRYFKNYSQIREKIIYIRDKDFLGFDSSNSNLFQFNYWKLKKFGISDNFISMDDDYFIGKRLLKKHFFYVENGKVVPFIITSKFLKIDKDSIVKKYNIYKSRVINNKVEQNDEVFNYSLHITFLLIMNEFKKKSMYIPKFTHNAIPVNINDLKEIYDLVFKSEYKLVTLYSLYREIGFVQFQQFYLSFVFIKYERKVRDISNKFIIINNSISANYNFHLFCINKGPYNYSYLYYYKTKIVMEKLFPNPTIYEIFDNYIIEIAFNVVKSMEKNINLYDQQNNRKFKINSINNIYKIFLLIFFFFLYLKYIPSIY